MEMTTGSGSDVRWVSARRSVLVLLFPIEPAQQPGSVQRYLDALGVNLYAGRNGTDEGVHIIRRQVIPRGGELDCPVNETFLRDRVGHFVPNDLMNLAGVGEPISRAASDECLQCDGRNTLPAGRGVGGSVDQ